MEGQVSSPPPPACISRDEYHAADSARQRLAPRSRVSNILSLPNLRKSMTPQSSNKEQQQKPIVVIEDAMDDEAPKGLIALDSSSLDISTEDGDKYEWAVVFENQRGMTIFSTPYYSRLSLLPTDPPPFTLPSATSKRSEQRSITLANYPLPDGTWKWVSKCWMIDMRSDTGEVQHDGFEYNWVFRTHGWTAEVGALSAGGWVRRRRWIRLMMRPASKHRFVSNNDTSDAPSISTNSGWRHHSIGSSTSLTIQHAGLEPLSQLLNMKDLWIKDDMEGNWTKCRKLMKCIGRDGRKIELWKTWLSHYQVDYKHAFEESDRKGKTRQKQWSEDEIPMPSETIPSQLPMRQLRAPPKEYLVAVLRAHGNELLQSFIYPDSRATFMMMLGMSGLLPEMNIGLGIGSGASEMDFWSYTNIIVDRFADPQSHAALKTYALSLSLSLGPSVVPFVTAFLNAKTSHKNGRQAFKRVLRRELGLDGFAFAMTVAVGGGAALREIWRLLDSRSQSGRNLKAPAARLNLSSAQKTFVSNFLSSVIGILLLTAGRDRSYRLRHHMAPPNTSIPLTPPTQTIQPVRTLRISDTLDLTLLLVVRAMDAVLQIIIQRITAQDSKTQDHSVKITKRNNSTSEAVRALTSKIDAFVFWACSARIMWCFFYQPERLPKSYVKWIATLANLDYRIIQALKLLREGRWSYVRGSESHSQILTSFSKELGYSASWGDPTVLPAYGGANADIVWKNLGVRSRSGIGGLPCELVHGSVASRFGLNDSCMANWSIRGAMAFIEAIAIYIPVHFLPTVLTRPHALLDPHQTLRTLLGTLQSASFLSAFVTLYWFAVCTTRSLVLARLFPAISHDFWDGPFGCIFAGSLACGSSIWIENGRRRGEMALYVLPRAIRAWLPDTWVRNSNLKLRFIERLAFALSFATLLTVATHRPEALRGLSRWTLSFISNGKGKPRGPTALADPLTARKAKYT